MTKADVCARYCEALGWSLVTIPAGSKAPRGMGWQRPEQAISTPEAAQEYWTANPDHNIGLLHSASGTVALDIDNVEWTRIIFDGLGLDYDALMSSAPRIVGRKDRGKALFRAPRNLDLSRRAISWPKKDGKGSEVVFELRGGAVQDVLPPSIHPDTGNPYTWAGADIWDGLPELPAPILTIWKEWDRFRPQMFDLCPWKPAPEFAPPRKPRPPSDRASVIDGFNAANDIHAALTKYGYKRCGGANRYLSPNSTSKLAGVVVFDDDRAYSHHASDPFDSAHTFDAFDLYAQYEHGGDVSKAVKAAGEFLGITRDEIPEYDAEAIAHGAKVAAQIMPRKADKSDHLLSVPGVLQDAVNWFNTTAVSHQPQFAVVYALALGCTVMGRRWRTDANNYSNCYFVCIGQTGSGKEYVRKALAKTLAECGLERLIGPSGYTAGSSVLSALIDKPTHVMVMDEFGQKLKQASARHNTNAQSTLTALMEVFGMQDGIMLPQGYSKAGLTKDQSERLDRCVKHPSLTVVGLSTVNDFAEAITFGDVASGFLNRFMIVETDHALPKQRVTRPLPFSERLKDWCRDCASAHDPDGGLIAATDGHDTPPAPVVVDFAPDAIKLLDQITDQIHSYRINNASAALSDMKSRSREIAMRLALVVARSCGEEKISAASLQWAHDFVTHYTDRTIRLMEKSMSVNDFHDACNRTIGAIEKSGLKGVTERDLMRQVPKLRGMKPREREDVFRALITDYGIVKAQREGKGRPTMAWMFPPDTE
jgi:hypothetical protein